MKIVVCIRQGLDGEINPFDACAYEEALRIESAEVTILSMGPSSAKDFLHSLTRLGAKKAILLCDKVFAGADTLATAYALSCAIKTLQPDLVFCGRQTLVGDTAQTGPMLSEMLGFDLITNVMSIDAISDSILCTTRDENKETATLPALITVERINNLRLPRLRSKLGEIEVLTAADIGAEASKCGLAGSPTRVISSFENEAGKRKCKFISKNMLESAIKEGLEANAQKFAPAVCEIKLEKVCTVGETPLSFAKTISDDITVLEFDSANVLAAKIQELSPNAVIWGSDSTSKKLAALVAAKLSLGLCADCTSLETDGKELVMYRPALSGSVIAKIRSLTYPAMATVRTEDSSKKDVVLGLGFGAKDCLDLAKSFAEKKGFGLAATRKLVDNSLAPYSSQVGLTGCTISPPVYIAAGISGAVHHIVGMQRSGTVIAINPDKHAPIFDYADYGIVAQIEDVLK